MSLLHATWLTISTGSSDKNKPVLFLWADTWRSVTPVKPTIEPSDHPFTLSSQQLRAWLNQKKLLPNEILDRKASLTLPSKLIKEKKGKNYGQQDAFLPIQAGETISTEYESWPWKIDGLALSPLEASTWLSNLPLSNNDFEISDEILWWTHINRWSLSLIARGLWLPKVELHQTQSSSYRARWVPLLNQETERRRLEEFLKRMPLITTCGTQWLEVTQLRSKSDKPANSNYISQLNPLASIRQSNNRIELYNLLEEIIDAQLRQDFEAPTKDLDPLLIAWQKALGSKDGALNLSDEDTNRLVKASTNWKGGISNTWNSAKTCLELSAPINDDDLWNLNFFLQAETDPSLKISAEKIWKIGSESIQIGSINIQRPSEILLEGLGRAIHVFPTIERGLEVPNPNSMQLSADEALLLIKTSSAKLRDIGISIILPKSLSKGLASRLGIAIQAELIDRSQGKILGEKLNWSWELMIGGIKLNMQKLNIFAQKNSTLFNHKGTWFQLRPNDLDNVEKFLANPPTLNLEEALRLTANAGNTLSKIPVHQFIAGPRLKQVLNQYHHNEAPEPLAAPEGFHGQLRPYQERGLGWLSFLHRFNQGACLADDMGLGKTVQLLAFIQYLKNQSKLKGPILLITPTSILTNWKRESLTFTPGLSLQEHYGPNRCSNIKQLQKSLNDIDIFMTSYGLLYRDNDLLRKIDWQGIVIDEAQAIKNPKGKQSILIREMSQALKGNPLKIALTGTPIENRISELWALMNFLNPAILGEEEFFNQRYKLPIEHYGDRSSLKTLQAQVNPFILRRVKTDESIISDLPKKIEVNEWINLTIEQEMLYKNAVENSLKEIASSPIGQRQGKALGLLTHLKQICNHPALFLKEKNINDDFLERSSKLQRLVEIIYEVIESNERGILFTQFAEWGNLLKSYFEKKLDFEVPFLYGATSKKSRQEMIDRFQEDPRGPNIFLLSLKAGGVGVNLTRASHVFHIDRWWNPAVENQATDRAYRIGQSKRVVVHKFITKGSIEEKVNQMISQKAQLAEEIVGSSENWLSDLSIDELSQLVALDPT
ncbi:DEAD/DEAH box helicase [Prochlorococcus marinus]|uniref:DEAD/DEAH box helicase n=1 Tax=Prochlorococcus marinus TaxID=1219 RepID=UPI0022B3BF3E|nr:DEAD/DEAH box helicase [Prochlorococcus marinus]